MAESQAAQMGLQDLRNYETQERVRQRIAEFGVDANEVIGTLASQIRERGNPGDGGGARNSHPGLVSWEAREAVTMPPAPRLRLY